jgi:sugar lactone lactonase YvrE
VVATERGFSLVDEGAGIRSLGALWADPGIRMNDGACDPQGRFYAGSMAYDESPGRGNLYRLDPSHDVTVVLTGVTVSNGLGWSPDGKTAYYIDSPTRRIDVLRFDPETGRFANRRPLVAVPEGDGVPDGLSVDSEGGIWVALWHGSALHRYLPDGSLDGTLSLPVSNPTSCAFGGVDLDTLFITTSAQSVSLDVEPAAGALFSCRPGFSGQPIGTFLG